MRVYLDNAATTPIDPVVAEAMKEVIDSAFGNPSSIHQEGRKSRTIIERARKKVASLMGVGPGEIFFTSGGTEADNMAIKGSIEHLGVTHIITSAIEHHAVLYTVQDCLTRNVSIAYVKILPNGHVDMEHLEHLIKDAPAGRTLVTLMHANNEIGNLLDVERVSALCKDHNALFHCDMVQTIGHLPINLKKTGVDFTAASAHKFNGPKGIGFIYINEELKLKPFIYGGSQERNMRAGTENIYGIVGQVKALEIACEEMEQQRKQISGLRSYMKQELIENIPGVEFSGDCDGKCLYTVLSVAFPPSLSSDMLLFNLDIEGIAASGGSACSSGSDAGSHVIKALEPKEGYTSIRFSFGKYNTREDIDFAIAKLKSIFKLSKVEA
ncbi:MAG: cysteine desulfurase [Bacteroidota bacterium]|nr:cysteine desulfurase [Bacteroidota bacterium]